MIDLQTYPGAVTTHYPSPSYRGAAPFMSLLALDSAQHGQTCGYWYTVRNGVSTPHTAFRTRAALDTWLRRTGLKLTQPLPSDIGNFAHQYLEGEFRIAMHLSADSFTTHRQRNIEEFRAMECGRFTTWFVTQDHDGIRTLHVCNPNVKWRDEWTELADIRRLQAEQDEGK